MGNSIKPVVIMPEKGTKVVFDINEADLRRASEKVFKLHEETKERIQRAQMGTIPLIEENEKWISTVSH